VLPVGSSTTFILLHMCRSTSDLFLPLHCIEIIGVARVFKHISLVLPVGSSTTPRPCDLVRAHIERHVAHTHASCHMPASVIGLHPLTQAPTDWTALLCVCAFLCACVCVRMSPSLYISIFVCISLSLSLSLSLHTCTCIFIWTNQTRSEESTYAMWGRLPNL